MFSVVQQFGLTDGKLSLQVGACASVLFVCDVCISLCVYVCLFVRVCDKGTLWQFELT